VAALQRLEDLAAAFPPAPSLAADLVRQPCPTPGPAKQSAAARPWPGGAAGAHLARAQLRPARAGQCSLPADPLVRRGAALAARAAGCRACGCVAGTPRARQTSGTYGAPQRAHARCAPFRRSSPSWSRHGGTGSAPRTARGRSCAHCRPARITRPHRPRRRRRRRDRARRAAGHGGEPGDEAGGEQHAAAGRRAGRERGGAVGGLRVRADRRRHAPPAGPLARAARARPRPPPAPAPSPNRRPACSAGACCASDALERLRRPRFSRLARRTRSAVAILLHRLRQALPLLLRQPQASGQASLSSTRGAI
jgi:hypothetical protein